MALSHKSPVINGSRTGERSSVSFKPSPAGHATREGRGPSVWFLAVPVLCCSGPAIFAALAAASAVTLGVVGGVTGAALLVAALGLFLQHRRRAACCRRDGNERP